MRVFQVLDTAFSSLRQNYLRAALTVLGIVIGIAAVIAMVEIGNGSAAAIQQTISSMGANVIAITPGTAASGGVSFGGGTSVTLTADDAEAIAREAKSLAHVAPVVRVRTQVIYGNKNWVPQFIYGTTATFLDVRDWSRLSLGQMFGEREIRTAMRVCVLGQTIVRELFGDDSPIGKEVRIQNVAFTVIGVLSSKGANMMGSDQDDVVIAPWTTIKYRVSGSNQTSANVSSNNSASSSGSSSTSSLLSSSKVDFYPPISENQSRDTFLMRRFDNIDQIMVSARSSGLIQSAMDEITDILRRRHRLQVTEPDDFTLRDMSEMMKTITATSRVVTNLLLIVSCISLIVGGVGIMNIMLVSVTERTREIGIRMAVGATPGDIQFQFLVEAIVLCVLGAVIGVGLGRMASYSVATFLKWPTEASATAIAEAVGVSISVGLIFGYYPARKASKLDIIEALRYE